MIKFTCAFIAILAITLPALPRDYMEKYDWSFTGGNLLGNWSFEEVSSEICPSLIRGNSHGMAVDCRFDVSKDNIDAVSGRRVLKVTTLNSNGVAHIKSQESDFTRCEPGTDYKFIFYVMADWSTPYQSIMTNELKNYPEVNFYRDDKATVDRAAFQGEAYESFFPTSMVSTPNRKWLKYTMSFKTGPATGYLTITLAKSKGADNNGNKFWFDNLQILRATEDESVNGSREYLSAGGRLDHRIQSNGWMDIISKPEYDAKGHMTKGYLPITRSVYSLEAVTVGRPTLTGAMPLDFHTIREAYDFISGVVRGLRFDEVTPNPVVINVIEVSGGGDAPLSSIPIELSPLMTHDGKVVNIELAGVLEGTSSYQTLLTLKREKVFNVPLSGPYTDNYPADLAAEYPGETNLYKGYEYPALGNAVVKKSHIPGGNYTWASGHYHKTGMTYALSGTIPQDQEKTRDPGSGEATHVYNWSKDTHGNYQVNVTSRDGRMSLTANNKVADPNKMDHWRVTANQYDKYNRLKVTTSPSGISTGYAYDGRGQVTASVDKDRGTVHYLYDEDGQTRFIRTAEGLSGNYFKAVKYDKLGRVLGETKIPFPAHFNQSYANIPDYPDDAYLNVGYMYDEFNKSAFETNTQATLSGLGFPGLSLSNTYGKLAVSYNRNLESVVPGHNTAAFKLAATFYSYDDEGRASVIYKYIGSAPDGYKWTKIKYEYSLSGRLSSTKVYADQTEAKLVRESHYIYDDKSRVCDVLDKDNNVIASYDFDKWDRTTGVNLYGRIQIGYQYDLNGKTTSSQASWSDGENIFSERIGYESQPDPGLPSVTSFKPRYDGKISAVLREYSGDVTKRHEYERYNYDIESRFEKSSTHTAATQGGIDYKNATRKWDYTYHADGEIFSKTGLTDGYVYNYVPGTHQLSRITKNGTSESFAYDSDGRMTSGRGNKYQYNTGNLPTVINANSKTFYPLYDESHYRVSMLEISGRSIQHSKVYVYESGLTVAKEITTGASGSPVLVKNYIYGRGGAIGVEESLRGTRRLAIKNHLGSIVKVVGGDSKMGLDERYYHPYGDIEPLLSSGLTDIPSESFTGKEYEPDLGLYYFGARFYDPELGVWLTPDPAGQFFNPYGYGGDPINYVDPDGEWIILAAISTYMLFKGVQNVAHHWDEISDDYGDGNWLQGTGKTIGVFGLGAVEGGVDVAALSYNYSPIGLVDRYSGLNIANDFIFAPIAGTLDYSSHALVYEEWDNADWSTAIREKAFWYRGGLGGFWGMMKTDFYNMQGEGRSFRGRYKRIQRKIDNCKQLRDKWEGAPPEEGTAERYQHGFSNSDFPRSEAKGVPGGSQMWHKFFGWTSSILGAETWLTSGMGGAKRHQYYGFEVYGESFEAWSEEDLRDDTQLDRFGYKPDWIDYHNSGCAELTGYGFWNR